jgi:ABC-type antimicrobial peptide transport system permease subunit
MPTRERLEFGPLMDRLASTVRDVGDGIRTHPGSAGLSFLAIAIGIASFSVLIALLGGLQDKSRQLVQELGINVLGIIRQSQTGSSNIFRLQEQHASLLTSNLPGCTVTTLRVYKVPTLGTSELLSVVATDESLMSVRQWRLDEGRFLDRRDLQLRERNVVVTQSLSRLWNWRLGNVIMLRDTPFRVVGIVSVGSGAMDAELADPRLMLGERVVFVPNTVTPYWATDQEISDRTVDAIFVRIPASLDFAHVTSTAQRLLSQPDYYADGISWVTPEMLSRKLDNIRNTISLTVGGIVLLCLVLGGTTLMSLMVANVRERIAEIGLRRAIGASQWDVASLFILEACMVTGAAAVLATLGAHLLLALFRDAFPIPLRLGVASVCLPLVVALILGAAFSYWPARSAARIVPSEALRNE